ncbi:MAG: AbrB/MazE/SpoVT family DNA-binding domain-containing protein, partial [Methylocystis sp.]|nr:AbrB/MazE/SpoVT family DNA-binding domain-containing protein [Methylocystis sp.]
MKNILKITSKGQVTFRKDVLDQLGVRPGDKIAVEFLGPGRVEVRAAGPSSSIEQFIGCLRQPGAPAMSLSEMKEVISKGWA